MSKGIIYLCTTVVPGLVKIGITSSDTFEQRMYNLEHNGYFNVTGLKRRFAIEVEKYKEKEALLDQIFERGRVPNSELFALDPELVVKLLSSFEGAQVYPKGESKKEAFEEAQKEEEKTPPEPTTGHVVPDGVYTLKMKTKGSQVTAVMRVAGEEYIVLKGSVLAPDAIKLLQKKGEGHLVDGNGVLRADISVASPSSAATCVTGRSINGWTSWKNEAGEYINVYRGG